MAAVAYSSCTKVNEENTGHLAFAANGPAVTAAERKASNFMILRVPMASTSDTVTLPDTMGHPIDFAYKSGDDTDQVLVSYNAALKRFSVSSATQHTVDIWLWYK